MNHNIYSNKISINTSLETQDVFVPLEIDIEFQEDRFPYDQFKFPQVITAQVRSCTDDPTGLIFAHPDIAKQAKHLVFQYPFVGLDYLEHQGWAIGRTKPNAAYPVCHFIIHTYFNLAEVYQIFQP